jgi:predicted PurR-regulated permease PerM
VEEPEVLGIDQKIARSAWVHAAVYGAVVLLICVVWVIRKTLLVFATALMFAYLLYPLVDRIERRLPPNRRAVAAAAPFLLILCLFTAFGWRIKKPLSDEYIALHKQFQEQGFRQEVVHWKLGEFDIGERIVDWYDQNDVMVVVPTLRKALGTGSRYLLNFFIIPILSFFILKDGRRIRDSFIEMFDTRRQAESILRDTHTLLLEYMRALLFLCLATLISFTVALNLMQVPYPIMLALVAFPLEFVPLVGPLTSAILIIGVGAIMQYQHLPSLVAFLIAYRLFQDYVLSPHLMKRGVNLHPLLVLFGVFAGSEIGNVPGIFLSVPVLALCRLVFYEWRKRPSFRKPQVASE